MKLILSILTVVFTSQMAFAYNGGNHDCSAQKKRERHASYNTCKGPFANELPSCRGKVKQNSNDASGTDYRKG